MKETMLTGLIEISEAGLAGVLPGSGRIVDRRQYPHAIPMQENKLLGIPAPRRVEERDCPNCYGGHQRPCQWCGDSGKVIWVEDAPKKPLNAKLSNSCQKK